MLLKRLVKMDRLTLKLNGNLPGHTDLLLVIVDHAENVPKTAQESFGPESLN